MGLFSPLSIKSHTFSNRVFIAPMCQYSAQEGRVNFWHQQHYGALAVGGAGALTFEATAVSPEGRITSGCLGLYTDEQEESLRTLVSDLRQISETSLGIQLAHAGRKAACEKPWSGGKKLKEGAWEIVAPSEIAFGESFNSPRAMEEQDFHRLLAAYVDSTERAERAGFDYLELHLAHGYLLNSFLSPISNQRTDSYGGSLKNRMKFPLEVVAKVRSVWPENKPLGVRINSHDWLEEGLTFEDTLEICSWLKSIGIDFVCVSAGAIKEGVKISAKPGYLMDYAHQIKIKTGLITRGVGLLHDPELANKLILDGKADCIAEGRALLDDPRWVLKAAKSLGEDIVYPKQYSLSAPSKWPPA